MALIAERKQEIARTENKFVEYFNNKMSQDIQ